MSEQNKLECQSHASFQCLIHSGRLRPYLQTLDQTTIVCSSIGDKEQIFLTLTFDINIIKHFSSSLMSEQNRLEYWSLASLQCLFHSGRLWPYSQTLDQARIVCASIGNKEQSFITLTFYIHVMKYFSLLLKLEQNKLECQSLASFQCLYHSSSLTCKHQTRLELCVPPLVTKSKVL